MDNLRSVLSIVLSKIPPSQILNGDICYDEITQKKFVQIAGYYVKHYSNDELENLFLYICNEYEEQADYVRGYAYHRNLVKNSFNVFNAVLIFAVRTLQELDGEPVCQYENMLRWRMTSHELDEDVFTTAYLAFKDVKYLNPDRTFSWRPVIRHNNVYLNKILSQGMADNHFHLKGSAPQFPLSWISMINNVTSIKFRKLLENYSTKRLSTIYSLGTEDHLYVSYLKAALIRCYIFAGLTGNELVLQDKGGIEKDTAGKKVAYGKEIEERAELTEKIVGYLLRDKDEILFYRQQIQDNIDYLRSLRIYNKKYALDYALNGNYLHEAPEEDVNFILSGERWLMYTMFQLIFSKNQKFVKYYNIFYAYLVIKGTIRSELVQTNENMGFDNFAKYQDRKEDFIDNTPFEKYYVEMAVKGTLRNQNIQHLEVRIAPKWSPEENKSYIKKFDDYFKKDSSLKEKYFYVFHFIKEKDNNKVLGSSELCRHYIKREKIRRQTIAITLFRKKYPVAATRLRGIDACAKEIGCRPEVFAQAYRFLRNHIVYTSEPNKELARQFNKDIDIGQLSLTYHIGEDYLDIVDGLRSMDEAVRLLQLDCGSRIGHALALGIDAEEYYQVKKNRILISQQDYLDDLVWLYYKIKQFGLSQCDDLLLAIEQEYSKYFRIIYGNHISDPVFHAVVKDARVYYRDREDEVAEGYCNSQFHFRISEYYDAWKLRGDDPLCYIKGYFIAPEDISEWSYYAVNRSHFVDNKIRYNPECAYLYHLYHYCGEAKKEGSKVIEIKINHAIVDCVKAVQDNMRKWIGKLGIGIEANPSSNYLIGPFKRYDKHPIIDFYNLGLTTSREELEKCPQLAVCINTDDQGIFSTYLENEYALLALALEKARDEDGNYKYNRAMIYQWIDNVRKLGLYLSFCRSKVQGNILQDNSRERFFDTCQNDDDDIKISKASECGIGKK